MCIGEFFVAAAGKIDNENLKEGLKRHENITKDNRSNGFVYKAGKEIGPYHCDVTYEDVVLSLKPMSEEEKEQFWELLHSLEYEYTYDEQLSDIISEEAEACFMGQKSLDEAVDSMEERVKLYFEEMK